MQVIEPATGWVAEEDRKVYGQVGCFGLDGDLLRLLWHWVHVVQTNATVSTVPSSGSFFLSPRSRVSAHVCVFVCVQPAGSHGVYPAEIVVYICHRKESGLCEPGSMS